MKKIQFLTLVILLGTSCYSATNEHIHQVTPPSPNAAVKFVDPFNDPEQVAKEKAMLAELDGISDDLKVQSERIHAESEEIKLQEYMKKVQEIKEKKAELMGHTVSGVKSVKTEEDKEFQEIVKKYEMERNFLLFKEKLGKLEKQGKRFDICFPEGSEFDSIVTYFSGRALPDKIQEEHIAEWANFYANQTPFFIVKKIKSDISGFSGYVVFMFSDYKEKWGDLLCVNVRPILAFNFMSPKIDLIDKPLTIEKLTAIMNQNKNFAEGNVSSVNLLDGHYDGIYGNSYNRLREEPCLARILPCGLNNLFDSKKLNQTEVSNFLESFKSLERDEVGGSGFRPKWSYNDPNIKEFEDNFMSLFAECDSLLQKSGGIEEITILLTHFSKPLLRKYLDWLNSDSNPFYENKHLNEYKKAVEEALK